MKKIKYLLTSILLFSFLAFNYSDALAQNEKSDTAQWKNKTIKEKKENVRKGIHQVSDDKQLSKKNDKESPVEKDSNKIKSNDQDQRLKEKNKDQVKADEEQNTEVEGKDTKAEEKDNGNAYGKNKNDLEGKEFGQSRADQARLNKQQKKQELDSSLVKGNEKVIEAREKIKVAKEKLEKDKKAKKISEAEYKEKKEKIDKAEKAVNDLEDNIQGGKGLKTE
jgi:colicin import membrane protein